MRKLRYFTKAELIDLVENIVVDIKENEGMAVARLLTDEKLMTEEEYEEAVNF